MNAEFRKIVDIYIYILIYEVLEGIHFFPPKIFSVSPRKMALSNFGAGLNYFVTHLSSFHQLFKYLLLCSSNLFSGITLIIQLTSNPQIPKSKLFLPHL